ncbi:hypothetical protein EGR_03580 [Echinococcus granulosus]|uniref:Uncharacterized protein n=1 Tax=Echinococcus granulosus TaxID=6210 RepID=W6UK48_ECHGR|nr:hypothetical protein EGR_03580 [Echinococcus granulosus]EUB61516.1 hypothetical protein EGR_03580 [Echinococcus granulosus]
MCCIGTPQNAYLMGTGSDGAAICSTSASLQLAQVLPQAFKKQNRVRHWALRTNLTLEQFLFAAIKKTNKGNYVICQSTLLLKAKPQKKITSDLWTNQSLHFHLHKSIAFVKGNLVSNLPINQKTWHYQPIRYTQKVRLRGVTFSRAFLISLNNISFPRDTLLNKQKLFPQNASNLSSHELLHAKKDNACVHKGPSVRLLYLRINIMGEKFGFESVLNVNQIFELNKDSVEIESKLQHYFDGT